MSKERWLGFLFILLVASAIFAQEDTSNIDELFTDPTEDIINSPTEDNAAIDHTKSFNVTKQASITGNFVLTGGVGFGWTDVPNFEDPYQGFTKSLMADSTFSGAFDARPDPDFRVHGAFSVTLDPAEGNFSWSPIAVDELFCDYTLLDKAFIRFGKQTIVWGQGRLYTPGNLMDGSEDGTSFRVAFPTIFSGLSFVTLAQNSYFKDPSNPSVTELAYGALADVVFGNFLTSFGLRYRNPEGYRGLASFKLNLLGTDFFCDEVGSYDNEKKISSTTLLGFFREWKKLTIYGEWQYALSETDMNNSVGAALAYNNLGRSTVDLGFKWLHTFDTNSGAVVGGVSWDPFKFVRTTIAIPIVYGNPGRYDILDEEMPLTQRVSMVFLVKLSASF